METLEAPRRAAPIKSPRPRPNRLREIREAKGITASEFAARLGVRLPTVSEAETRRSGAFGRNTWLRVSEILDTDLRILLAVPDGAQRSDTHA